MRRKPTYSLCVERDSSPFLIFCIIFVNKVIDWCVIDSLSIKLKHSASIDRLPNWLDIPRMLGRWLERTYLDEATT